MGPIAWAEAGKVAGVRIDDNRASITGEARTVLDALVARYARLFGEASVAVCRDAAKPFSGKVSATLLPVSLR